MDNCFLCPRQCMAKRTNGKYGFCGADNRIKIARAALHFWEEPSISGGKGSGAVFFSHCHLKCVYCQNYEISTEHNGYYVTDKELSDIFLDLQSQGANNINLVTPTHYIDKIVSALDIAKSNGLSLPVIYNCGGYENVKTIKKLNGYIDIYMPDMKYFNDQTAVKYSKAPDYFKISAKAIWKMFNQVGKNQFGKDGIMTRGVLVRHLMLPSLMYETKKIIDYLYKTYGDDIYLSIMSQYTPTQNTKNYPEINRRISKRAYDTIIDYCQRLGIKNAYIQDLTAADEELRLIGKYINLSERNKGKFELFLEQLINQQKKNTPNHLKDKK